MGAGTLIAFVSQISLLLFFAKRNNLEYSEKTLFVIVFIYSLLLGTVLMALSYVYDGDTYMMTKFDAMVYFKESIRAHDVGFLQNMTYIMKKYEFDDWGAFCFDSFLMSIIPSKYFLNLAYMIAGAISSILLYRIGRHYMSDAYAFIGALAYGTSSFIISFHCTFLKESLFVAIVVCAMYNLCKFIHHENNAAPFGLVIFLGLLFFFRPAVAAFIVMGVSVYFAIKMHGSALSLFMYLGIIIIFIIALQSMMDMADAYSHGSEEKLMQSGNANAYSGGFTTFVSIFGGFFGPFPTLFTKPDSAPTTIQFYGAGLTYKLFLILPFFAGIYFIIKNKVLGLIPVLVFLLVEMLLTGMVHASLELRKVLPHIPFTYVVSFYGLSKWQDSNISKRIPEASIYTLAIGILILWNVVKST